MKSSFALLTLLVASFAHAADVESPKTIALGQWKAEGLERTDTFRIDGRDGLVEVWGRGPEPRRAFFDELLPALFERTLVIDALDLGNGRLEWIFTGPRGGVTVIIEGDSARLVERFYDSFAFNYQSGKAARHPEWQHELGAVKFTGALRAVTLVTDHKLGLNLALNGETVIQSTTLQDFSRHQLRITSKTGKAEGSLLLPKTRACRIDIDPSVKHQTIIGFGGITTPTAYRELGPGGRRRWWELVAQYNLLIQREYPVGTRLNEGMDNWDRSGDATPHYYGDNFPNGEISDFAYIKTLRKLGGQVWFEFWGLPPWAEGKPEKYAAAMVDYCRKSQEKVGAPPEVVGIQNERPQKFEMFHKMTLELRRQLDAAGFQNVKIHMSDASNLREGLKRAAAFKQSPEVWKTIDYAATHLYDYQRCFRDPDAFDKPLAEWKKLTGDKPFLSTEMCINSSDYQADSYRMALAMGQLYHKNLVVADAAALCYCWTLLNAEQPSYGATRSLCVVDRHHSFVPGASSNQLRVFGAYSRHIRKGMVRIDAKPDDSDLLVSAFADEKWWRTVIVLNRSTKPQQIDVPWPATPNKDVEFVDPATENKTRVFGIEDGDRVRFVLAPGAIVTLSSVPSGFLSHRFLPEESSP